METDTAQGSTSHTGSCRCGAIRFEAKADPFYTSYCHCEDCRRATGSPVAAFVGFLKDEVHFHGEVPSTYGREPVRRSFCRQCGAPLFYTDQRIAEQIFIMLGAMDRPEDFPPRIHGYVRERLPFLHIDDNLPRLETSTAPRHEGTMQ